jgi:hypothetical protein
MKQKAYTRTEVNRLIREIAEVTQQNDVTSEYFAALISAMRGPDVPGDNDKLKHWTTMVIRSRLGWRCGLMGDADIMLSFVQGTAARAESSHFRTHIVEAVNALEYFGYGDKQNKGGKKA